MSGFHLSDRGSKSRRGTSKDRVLLDDMAVSEAHGRSEPYIVPERKSTQRSCAESPEPKKFKDEVDSLANDVYATYDAAVVAMKEECYEETAIREFKIMASELLDHLKKTAKTFTSAKFSPDKVRKEIVGYAHIWIKEADRLNGNYRDSDEWGEEILLCVESSLTQVRRIEKALRSIPEEHSAPLKRNLMKMLEEMINIANAPWEKLENEMEDEVETKSEKDIRSEKTNRSRVDVVRSQASIDRRLEYREHLSRVKLDGRSEELAKSRTNTQSRIFVPSKSQIPNESKNTYNNAGQVRNKESTRRASESEEKDVVLESERLYREEEKIRNEERRYSREGDKGTSRDEEKKIFRDVEKRAPHSEEKRLSSDEERRLARTEVKELSRDEEKRTSRDEEKRMSRDEEKRGSREEEKTAPRDELKRASRDEPKRASRDEPKRVSRDEPKRASQDEFDEKTKFRREERRSDTDKYPDIDKKREEANESISRKGSKTLINEVDVKKTPRDEVKSRPESRTQIEMSKSKSRTEPKKPTESEPKKGPGVEGSKSKVNMNQSRTRVEDRKSTGTLRPSRSTVTQGKNEKESKK